MSEEQKSNKSLSIFEKLELSIDATEKSLRQMKKTTDLLKQEIKQHRKLLFKAKNKMTKISTKQKSSRKPCGFARPSKVSNELCIFLGKEPGTEISRTDVTKSLIQYIKENKLQNEKRRREIIPDEKLKALFGKDAEGQELTYFTMQKYVNHHFIK